jgi:hypothetical protein
VPSPRQKVELDADVPLLRFVTGKFPVTSADNDTAPNVGAPEALPCSTVVAVPKLASGAGAAPAPPPTIRALAVNAALEDIADAPEKYGTPPEVPAVKPVPPFATGKPVAKLILASGNVTVRLAVSVVGVSVTP